MEASFINILFSSAFILNIALGFFLYKRGSKENTSRAFSFVIFSIAFWTISILIYLNQNNPADVVFWANFSFLAVSTVPPFFLCFLYIFPTPNCWPIKNNNFLLFSPMFLIWFLALSSNITIRATGIDDYDYGFGYPIFFIYFILFMGFAFLKLYHSYKTNSGIAKIQIEQVLVGTSFFAIIAGILSLFLPMLGVKNLIIYGPLYSVILVLLITYAITRYRLMDVLVIIRKSTVYTLTISTLSVFSLALFLFIANFLPLQYNALALAIAIMILISSLIFYPRLEDSYTDLANKYFFAALYETEKVFQDLVKKIPAILNLDELLELISQILIQTFKAERLGIWFINTKKEAQALKIVGFTPNDNLSFIEDRHLLKFLERTGQPLIIEEIEKIIRSKSDGGRRKFAKIKEQMAQSKMAIVIPLIVKKELVGLATLGPKLTAEAYTTDDVKMLEILANQSASALENAKLYTETQHFAETMKQEVIKATHDLRRLNRELKRLDAAKSEFISIASHQLRTPLTAIKGYVSMIGEGDFGPVNKQLEEPLKRVYLSNQRLIDLVENLLNISRMESGRMQYYFEPVDLAEFVDGLIKDLQILADKKGIYIKYNRPKKPLTKFFADQEKLRQIVMNLIDNSIKYTKVGGINVTVREEINETTKDKKLIFIVEDTGMGIDKNDLPLLFRKFERGKGVSLVHTEGTGLGLYVCKQLVEAHKGKVWAESEGKGKGARFIAEFPVLDEPPKVDSKPVSPLGQPVVQITSTVKPANLNKLPVSPEKR